MTKQKYTVADESVLSVVKLLQVIYALNVFAEWCGVLYSS
jgi:hypothetical protein